MDSRYGKMIYLQVNSLDLKISYRIRLKYCCSDQRQFVGRVIWFHDSVAASNLSINSFENDLALWFLGNRLHTHIFFCNRNFGCTLLFSWMHYAKLVGFGNKFVQTSEVSFCSRIHNTNVRYVSLLFASSSLIRSSISFVSFRFFAGWKWSSHGFL